MFPGLWSEIRVEMMNFHNYCTEANHSSRAMRWVEHTEPMKPSLIDSYLFTLFIQSQPNHFFNVFRTTILDHPTSHQEHFSHHIHLACIWSWIMKTGSASSTEQMILESSWLLICIDNNQYHRWIQAVFARFFINSFPQDFSWFIWHDSNIGWRLDCISS